MRQRDSTDDDQAVSPVWVVRPTQQGRALNFVVVTPKRQSGPLMAGDDSMRQAERMQRAPLRRFTYSRKGYEIAEVDRFVTDIGNQLAAAQQRMQLLEHQLDQLSHENE